MSWMGDSDNAAERVAAWYAVYEAAQRAENFTEFLDSVAELDALRSEVRAGYGQRAEQTHDALTSGGTPHEDTEGATYRWEARPGTASASSRSFYYVLRKGRGSTEKVVGKWRRPDAAQVVCDALNAESPWEVL